MLVFELRTKRRSFGEVNLLFKS